MRIAPLAAGRRCVGGWPFRALAGEALRVVVRVVLAMFRGRNGWWKSFWGEGRRLDQPAVQSAALLLVLVGTPAFRESHD